MFDLVSDWVNGILMLTAGGHGHESNNKTLNVTAYEDACVEDNEQHVAWGSLTIGLSWVPALFGLIFLVAIAYEEKRICNWLLLPFQFVFWPIGVGLMM